MTCIFCKLSNVAYHWLWAFGSALYYRFPSKELTVIGITGTKGKSTVVEMAHAILQAEGAVSAEGALGKAGLSVASASSVRFRIGDKEEPNMLKMTMPGKGVLQKFLREAVDAGCKYAVLEVTSEGIRQYRHAFIDFDTAVFTNLSPEHIESHGSFEKYRAEKMKLFRALNTKIPNPKSQIPNKFKIQNSKFKTVCIVNLDDENAEYFLKPGADMIYGYKIKNENEKRKTTDKNIKIIEAEDVRTSDNGIEFKINYQSDQTSDYSLYPMPYTLSLLGEFQIYNALAAICVGLAYGVPLETAARALEKFQGVPGRMEVVMKEPFRVIVDYAHTPDALEKVYKTISNLKSQISKPQLKIQNSRLVCVLGAAGGGRDKWKRPEFGKIAAQYCDEIILTDEDPYDEDPTSILHDIEKGLRRNYQLPTTSHQLVLDRREAIRKAIELAHPGDTVIITGKGCEPWMMTKKGKVPWDDRQIVRDVLAKSRHNTR